MARPAQIWNPKHGYKNDAWKSWWMGKGKKPTGSKAKAKAGWKRVK